MHRILVTQPVAERHGAAILAAAGAGVELILARMDGTIEPGVEAADIAFMSTELIGSGTKDRPGVRLTAFTRALDAGASLRWVHTCSSGSDRPVLQRLMRRGVTVTTSSGANAAAVAHSALAGMLALAREVPHWIDAQRSRIWAPVRDRHLPRDVDGAHVVIVGTGPIGCAIARPCRAMGMRVTGVRRQALPHPEFDAVHTLAELNTVAAGADWLVLCCPLTPDTRGLVNADLLAALPAHAALINVSRGEVVDEPALFAAVRAGRLLGGVHSDVFADEPLPPDSPWWTLPRTLVSAHRGGLSAGFSGRTVDIFLDNLGRLNAGQPLRHVAAPFEPGSAQA